MKKIFALLAVMLLSIPVFAINIQSDREIMPPSLPGDGKEFVFSIAQGWNLISFPYYTLSNPTAKCVDMPFCGGVEVKITDSTCAALSLWSLSDSKQYVKSGTVSNGATINFNANSGSWVFSSNECTFTASGELPNTAYAGSKLTKGWNLIAAPNTEGQGNWQNYEQEISNVAVYFNEYKQKSSITKTVQKAEFSEGQNKMMIPPQPWPNPDNTNWNEIKGSCNAKKGPLYYDAYAKKYEKSEWLVKGNGYFVYVESDCTLGSKETGKTSARVYTEKDAYSTGETFAVFVENTGSNNLQIPDRHCEMANGLTAFDENGRELLLEEPNKSCTKENRPTVIVSPGGREKVFSWDGTEFQKMTTCEKNNDKKQTNSCYEAFSKTNVKPGIYKLTYPQTESKQVKIYAGEEYKPNEKLVLGLNSEYTLSEKVDVVVKNLGSKAVKISVPFCGRDAFEVYNEKSRKLILQNPEGPKLQCAAIEGAGTKILEPGEKYSLGTWSLDEWIEVNGEKICKKSPCFGNWVNQKVTLGYYTISTNGVKMDIKVKA